MKTVEESLASGFEKMEKIDVLVRFSLIVKAEVLLLWQKKPNADRPCDILSG